MSVFLRHVFPLTAKLLRITNALTAAARRYMMFITNKNSNLFIMRKEICK